jgi:hypothetical protein
MTTNIFSTYSSGENRVTASLIAVLQSLTAESDQRRQGVGQDGQNARAVAKSAFAVPLESNECADLKFSTSWPDRGAVRAEALKVG